MNSLIALCASGVDTFLDWEMGSFDWQQQIRICSHTILPGLQVQVTCHPVPVMLVYERYK